MKIGKQTENPNNLTFQTELDKKNARIKKYRQEASRLVSMANKRLIRLESNKLTDTPAYQNLMVDGDGSKPRFGIRGKSYNEVQQEVAKMNKFINAQTSTVRGANNVLKDMAKNTGIKYKNLTELKTKSKQFFELASKVEQYLRTVDDMASAIGYQKIWEAVNTYIQKEREVLNENELDIEKMTAEITKSIKEYEKENYKFYGQNTWFQLGED